MSINPVSLKPALIAGGCTFAVGVLASSYVALSHEPGQPALPLTNVIKRIGIILFVWTVISVVIGSVLHSIMFNMANPKIAAADFAISQTRNAIFGV